MEAQGSGPMREPSPDCADAYTGRYHRMVVLYSTLHVRQFRETSPPTVWPPEAHDEPHNSSVSPV